MDLSFFPIWRWSLTLARLLDQRQALIKVGFGTQTILDMTIHKWHWYHQKKSMSITAGYGGDCFLGPYLGYVSHIHHLPPLYNGRLIAIDGRWGQITSQAMLYISFIVSKGIPLLFSVFFCEIIVSRFSGFFVKRSFPLPHLAAANI